MSNLTTLGQEDQINKHIHLSDSFKGLDQYDSSLFHCNQAISLSSDKSLVNKHVETLLLKVNLFQKYSKYDDAYRLIIAITNDYCIKGNQDTLCDNCDLAYLKLSEFMNSMGQLTESSMYLEKIEHKISGPYYAYAKANLHLTLGDEDSALLVMNWRIEELIAIQDTYHLIGAYNQKGIICQRLKKLEEAITSYNLAIQTIQESGHRQTLEPTIIGNIGACFLLQNKLDQAFEYLTKDAQGSLETENYPSFTTAEIALVNLEIKLEQHAQALSRLEYLWNNFEDKLTSHQKLSVLKLLTEVHSYFGNSVKEIEFLNKYMLLSIEVNNENNLNASTLEKEYSSILLNQVKIQLTTEKELSDQKLLNLQKQRESENILFWIYVSIPIILIIIILLLFWNYRNLHIKKENEAKNQIVLELKEKEILRMKIEEESKHTKMLALELKNKQDFSGELLTQIKEIESISKTDFLGLEMFIQNELDLKNTRIKLQSNAEIIGNDFVINIKRNHPKLTDVDLKLCTLVLMKMSNKEISISKNITHDSVKIAKYRLKKKLGLGPKDSLYDYLSELT